jgi:capsular exopolysaccharide synthesis family protein
MGEAQEVSSLRILEPPLISNKPFSPNTESSLMMGAFIGLSLGLLFASIKHRLDRRIHEVEEVREIIDIPLLASIPMADVTSLVSANSQKISPTSTYYAFKESLNSLALTLPHLGADNMMKVIAFTSSVPSEGKSTLIYSLGNVLSSLGYRVIVVDADLRNPTIHKLARLSNRFGLSTALTTDTLWQDLIQLGGEDEALHILASGSIPRNPMLLLNSNKMTTLLQEWREEYDYVLVDTPPVVGITDAQCLTKVDTFILVAAINHSTRGGISRALEILATAKANVSGLLINMIDSSDSAYHYGYYNRYYLSQAKRENE